MEDPRSTSPVTQIFSGRCMGGRKRQIRESAADLEVFFPSDCFLVKSFNRIPTKAEWNRFRKYAGGMRALKVDASQDLFAPEVLSALQLRTGNDPFLPRLCSCQCTEVTEQFIPFIPLLLSQQIENISVTFARTSPIVMVASTISRFPTWSPNIQRLYLTHLPRNPLITEAVSEMVLACNRDTLRVFVVTSSLTEEARRVLYTLPKLRLLSAVLRGPTSLPPVVLPDLAGVSVAYDHGSDWLQLFLGGTFGKLGTVTFFPSGSAQIDGFLEKFQSAAVSFQDTLSEFRFRTLQSWSPSYSSLLAFKQLKILEVDFSCHTGAGCWSQVDDSVAVSIAQAMPRMEILRLGREPCSNPTGLTLKGLVALAHHCPQLSKLRVHLHLEELAEAMTRTNPMSLSEPVAIPRMECALTELQVGEAPFPPEASLTIALALVQLFPRIHTIEYLNSPWKSVVDSITLFNNVGGHIYHTSKMPPAPYSDGPY